MESPSQINFAENGALLDGAGEVIEVGEVVGVLEGEVVEAAKVSTRPLRAVRLGLQVQRGAVVVRLARINSFNNAQPFHFHPSSVASDCFGAPWQKRADLAPNGWAISCVDGMLDGMIDFCEIRLE